MNQLISTLPNDMRLQVLRKRRSQDQWQTLIGKLLVAYSFKEYSGGKASLDNIKLSQHGRPSFGNDIDFNISHSGKIVICAYSEGFRVGVDIEQLQDIDTDCFLTVFSKDEHVEINKSSNRSRLILSYWTIKEAISKAIGYGLSVDLLNMNVLQSPCCYLENTWFFSELLFDGYVSHVATNDPHANILIQQVVF